MSTGASKAFGRAILPALVLATVGMLIAASSSFGQAAVEQYIPDVNPTGHHNGGGSGNGNGAGGSGSSTVAPSTASGGGSGTTGSGNGNGSTGSAGKKAAAGAAVAGLSNLPPGGGGGSSSGGSAPGTDFPLTTFVFIVIGIFLAGLLVYVLLKRRRPRSSAAL